MHRYWLAAHAYVAKLGPQVVFFDATRNTFCALRAEWICSLRPLIEDWDMPELMAGEHAAIAPDDHCTFLVSRGLLTAIPSEGKPMNQVQIPKVQRGVVYDRTFLGFRIGPIGASRLVRYGMSVAWQLRRRSFHQLLEQIARSRKRICSEPPTNASSQNVSHAVLAYWHIRPILPFDRHTDLIDSLTLLHHLSQYLMFPTLVIGIQILPFSSHAWIQLDDMVLNDSPEFVRQFTPIFAF